MSEPISGITAQPDEHNGRYFHVQMAGPKDVSGFLFFIKFGDKSHCFSKDVQNNKKTVSLLKPCSRLKQAAFSINEICSLNVSSFISMRFKKSIVLSSCDSIKLGF